MKTTLKTEPRQIRLPITLWCDLEREATADQKSRAELIRDILLRFVRWRKQQRKMP
jgi:hypothetical protein